MMENTDIIDPNDPVYDLKVEDVHVHWTDLIDYKIEDMMLLPYLKEVNDLEFREALSDSLENKRIHYDNLKENLEKEKIELRIAVERMVDKDYNGDPRQDVITDMFWSWIWKVFSGEDIRKLESLASQIRNLDVALKLARSLANQESGIRPNKRGYTDDEVFFANSIPVLGFIQGKALNTGGKMIVKCPFHSEKKGSMCIYTDNSWHCFGCGAHGNGAIDFIKKQNSLKFLDAVGFLLGKSI